MATPLSKTVASDSGFLGKEEDENSTSSLPPPLHGGIAPAQAPTNHLILSGDSMFGGETLSVRILGSGGTGATEEVRLQPSTAAAAGQQDQDQDHDHEAATTDGGGGGLVQQQGDEVATAGGDVALLPSPHHQRRENAEGAASAEGQGGRPARRVPLGQQESTAATSGELTLLSSALSSRPKKSEAGAANPTHSSPQESQEDSQEPTGESEISSTLPASTSNSAAGAANPMHSSHQEAREESQEPTAGSEISPTLPGSASNSSAGVALSSQEPQEESRELIGGSELSPTLPGIFEDVEAENPVFPPTEDLSGTGAAPMFFVEDLVSPQEEVNQYDSDGAGPVMPASSEENSLQGEYSKRLMEKDSTISELRLKEKEMQQNLEDTENRYKIILGEKEAEIEVLKCKVTDYQLRLSKAQKSHNAKAKELQSKIKSLEEELKKKEEEICRIKKEHEAQIESFKKERDVAQMELRMKEAIHEKERSDLMIEIMKEKLTIANMETNEASLKQELAEERQKKAEKERDVVMERLNSVASTSSSTSA